MDEEDGGLASALASAFDSAGVLERLRRAASAFAAAPLARGGDSTPLASALASDDDEVAGVRRDITADTPYRGDRDRDRSRLPPLPPSADVSASGAAPLPEDVPRFTPTCLRGDREDRAALAVEGGATKPPTPALSPFLKRAQPAETGAAVATAAASCIVTEGSAPAAAAAAPVAASVPAAPGRGDIERERLSPSARTRSAVNPGRLAALPPGTGDGDRPRGGAADDNAEDDDAEDDDAEDDDAAATCGEGERDRTVRGGLAAAAVGALGALATNELRAAAKPPPPAILGSAEDEDAGADEDEGAEAEDEDKGMGPPRCRGAPGPAFQAGRRGSACSLDEDCSG